MSKIVIGLVGRKGAGKGTVAALVKKRYGADTYRFSDCLREILAQLSIPDSRENLIKLSEILRQGFGQDALKRALAARARKSGHDLIVIDGIRRLDDLNGLEELGEIKLVAIEAPMELRYERISKRGENADETAADFELFKQQENAPTEITIAEVEARAWSRIDNSRSYEELERQVEELVKKLFL